MTSAGLDPRLVLSEAELDGALEQLLLAEAAIWMAADAALSSTGAAPEADPARGEGPRLGRGHWRAAFLIRRRPGLGVKELAGLTGLSKQGASRVLRELEAAGLVDKGLGEDARRRPATLTPAGLAFEMQGTVRLRASLARAYRVAGVENAAGARRVWNALARTPSPKPPSTPPPASTGRSATARGEDGA